MISQPSRSSHTAAFDQLHPAIQRWVYEQGWPALHPIQQEAIAPVLAASQDVIITAGTAGGKTEAAWLPICSRLAFDEEEGAARLGIKAIYISPLKALINDQAERLERLGERIDLPVLRRHGDVTGRERADVLRNPDGILLITPESLEALFMLHGSRVPAIFAGLRYIVIDEFHAFIGSVRGAQLQSLLHRLDLATGARPPRIALSATIADTGIAARFLRPGHDDRVSSITGGRSGSELRMQVSAVMSTADSEPGIDQIARHLFSRLRGENNLIFANSRSRVEAYTDRLAALCREARVPNEFFPHHGSLSKGLREDLEERLKMGGMPTTAICTSTLELGIDIGSVTSVAQIGSPGLVSSLRQRLGRSGRRGAPSILRVYLEEPALAARSHPADLLRPQLIETIAILDLMLEHWIEPPNTQSLHLSTLVQQILSIIAQYGGRHAAPLYDTLCRTGPFADITPDLFMQVLRSLGENDILMQASDGLLLPGRKGEQLISHYSFYAAFTTAEEYRLVADGVTIGSLPIDSPVVLDSRIIFAGRRWRVVGVDPERKIIELAPARGGEVPMFSGVGPPIDHAIRQRMRTILAGEDTPRYLDATARALLDEARANFRLLRLDEQCLVAAGSSTLLFPWAGDRIMVTLELLLSRSGADVTRQGIALEAGLSEPEVLQLMHDTLSEGTPDPIDLALRIADKHPDKHDHLLSESLLITAAATRDVDVPRALETLRHMLDGPGGTAPLT